MNKTQDRTLDWLLEPADIGVRYLALRDLVDADPADLAAARTRAHREGPIARVLDQMEAAGYWVEPGPGYNPKYTSTVWSVILLAQLGASAGRTNASAWPAPTCWSTPLPRGQFASGPSARCSLRDGRLPAGQPVLRPAGAGRRGPAAGGGL